MRFQTGGGCDLGNHRGGLFYRGGAGAGDVVRGQDAAMNLELQFFELALGYMRRQRNPLRAVELHLRWLDSRCAQAWYPTAADRQRRRGTYYQVRAYLAGGMR